MEKIPFYKLVLKTAFCCMACDGHIDEREINLIKSMCEKSQLFENLNLQNEINELVTKINERGKEYIKYYFDLLENSDLKEEEELILIDFAINTIKADEEIEYSEIKFFKNIRHRLKVSDEKILEIHPDIEMFLEQDINTTTSLRKITSQYLDSVSFNQFNKINIDNEISKDTDKE